MSEDFSNARILLVGPGRAGRAFARSWTGAGGALRIAARDPARAGISATDLAAVPVVPLDGAADLGADLLLLAVPDDSLAPLAARLSSRGRWRAALHFSGALASGVLAPLAAAGASLGSLHPLRAFTGLPGDDWRDTFVAVEGEPAAVAAAETICGLIGARPHRIRAENKPLYHLAATLAAGGTASLLSLAARAWSDAGLDEDEGRVALAGLARSAVEAVSRLPFDAALTGAVARRDVSTILLHRAALAGRPELAQIYGLLAAETLRRTAGRGEEREISEILGISAGDDSPDDAEIGKKTDRSPPRG